MILHWEQSGLHKNWPVKEDLRLFSLEKRKHLLCNSCNLQQKFILEGKASYDCKEDGRKGLSTPLWSTEGMQSVLSGAVGLFQGARFPKADQNEFHRDNSKQTDRKRDAWSQYTSKRWRKSKSSLSTLPQNRCPRFWCSWSSHPSYLFLKSFFLWLWLSWITWAPVTSPAILLTLLFIP